jgi:hypothetical protein
MKATFLAVLTAFMILTLTGCGSDNNDGPPPVFVSEILSTPDYDGDIKRDFTSGFLTVAQGSAETQQRVYAGLDPFNPAEYRSFLHFPLRGVPGDAIIESAFLEIFINHVDIQFPADTIPMRIELVFFQPPVLIESDFDLPPAHNIPVIFPIFLADSDEYVKVDVTSLMIAAQRLRYSDFQVRIMEDFGVVTPGLIEINNTIDLVNRRIFAPLLTVYYY